MMKKSILMAGVLTGFISHFAIAGPIEVETVEKAYSIAIQSPERKGSFILGGQKGEDMKRLMHTHDPVHLDVAVIGNLQKPECKRLRGRWSQAGVVEKKAVPKDMSLKLLVSYCTDTQIQYDMAIDK